MATLYCKVSENFEQGIFNSLMYNNAMHFFS